MKQIYITKKIRHTYPQYLSMKASYPEYLQNFLRQWHIVNVLPLQVRLTPLICNTRGERQYYVPCDLQATLNETHSRQYLRNSVERTLDGCFISAQQLRLALYISISNHLILRIFLNLRKVQQRQTPFHVKL